MIDEGSPEGPSVEVWAAQPPAQPVVASLPHGGTYFPGAEAAGLIVARQRLWTDWDTPRLYRFLPGIGIATLVNRLSRFVADPNRELRPPLHGNFWQTAVPATTTRGTPIYLQALDEEEVARRIELAHRPYHAALDELLGRCSRLFPRVMLLDLHSFGVDLPADVIIGDANGRSADPRAVALLDGALSDQGFHVERNLRFTGGWITRRFIGQVSVDSIQVELNHRTYVGNRTRGQPAWPPPADDTKFNATRQRLLAAITEVARGYRSALF
jgi:N-formylglutamate deformylase